KTEKLCWTIGDLSMGLDEGVWEKIAARMAPWATEGGEPPRSVTADIAESEVADGQTEVGEAAKRKCDGAVSFDSGIGGLDGSPAPGVAKRRERMEDGESDYHDGELEEPSRKRARAERE